MTEPMERQESRNLDGQAFMSAPEAAVYLGVSASYFRRAIRASLPMHDFRAPGSGTAVPRYAKVDLDAWALSRRRERKTA